MTELTFRSIQSAIDSCQSMLQAVRSELQGARSEDFEFWSSELTPFKRDCDLSHQEASLIELYSGCMKGPQVDFLGVVCDKKLILISPGYYWIGSVLGEYRVLFSLADGLVIGSHEDDESKISIVSNSLISHIGSLPVLSEISLRSSLGLLSSNKLNALRSELRSVTVGDMAIYDIWLAGFIPNN